MGRNGGSLLESSGNLPDSIHHARNVENLDRLANAHIVGKQDASTLLNPEQVCSQRTPCS